MKHFRLHGLPFAVYDEFGKSADDRVEDYAAHCVASATEPLRRWIAEEGERSDTCTRNILGVVCNNCRCGKSR